MAQIVLPNQFRPRPYQAAVMNYLDKGGLRACSVWHRRAGKDTTGIHQAVKMAHQRRGLYWHMLPTQRQARKVVWDAFTRDGKRLIDQAIPHELRKGDINNTDMKITMRCGSIYQLVGSDNYNALLGSNPIGVILSEWSLADPRVWDYLRPILLENGGWAWFIYTPRGYNHGWDMKVIAEREDDWFFSLKTVNDTHVVSVEQIDQERRDGMPEELVQQEFYCSFSSANVGAILGQAVEQAENEGRISDDIETDPDGSQIAVSCDIGFYDTAAFWYWQIWPDGAALVDYQEDSGLDAQDWIALLLNGKYDVGKLWLPHDARAKTFATRHSVLEQFLKAGFQVQIVPQVRIMDRINAARTVFPGCRFNKTRCERGIMALRDWSYRWDDQRRTFSKDPQHNWASHGADGFTYGALMIADHAKSWQDKRTEAIRKAEFKQSPEGAHYAFTLEQLHATVGLDNKRERL